MEFIQPQGTTGQQYPRCSGQWIGMPARWASSTATKIFLRIVAVNLLRTPNRRSRQNLNDICPCLDVLPDCPRTSSARQKGKQETVPMVERIDLPATTNRGQSSGRFNGPLTRGCPRNSYPKQRSVVTQPLDPSPYWRWRSGSIQHHCATQLSNPIFWIRSAPRWLWQSMSPGSSTGLQSQVP